MAPVRFADAPYLDGPENLRQVSKGHTPDIVNGFAAMTGAMTDNGVFCDGSDPIKSQSHLTSGDGRV